MSDIELWDSRTRRLLGGAAADALAEKHVLVLGLGGVGGYVAEFLARCGVGKLTLIDGDRVALSNLNRQLPALRSTVAGTSPTCWRGASRTSTRRANS